MEKTAHPLHHPVIAGPSNRRNFLIQTATVSSAGLVASTLPAPQLLTQPKTTVSACTVEPTVPTLLPDALARTSQLGLDARIWNWHHASPLEAAMPANYYEASLAPWPSFGALHNDRECDVVVIGGGLLGASAALHLCEKGMDVVLLEKDHIGSGASGRNGGQLTPGLARWEAETILENLSTNEARKLWRFASVEAMELIDSLGARYAFECDRKHGHLTTAVHAGHMGALVANADARRLLGDGAVHIMGPHELQQLHVRSGIYHGAALDSSGGQVHPLALLRGIVHGFVMQGGCVHDRTEVQEIRQTTGNTMVVTAKARVRARKAVVLAVHGSTFKFLSGNSTTVPFYTYVGVTPALAQDVRELLPTDLPVYDTQLQVDYYRAVRGNRLLFGGQGTGNSWSARDVNQYLLDRIQTVFPQIERPTLEYSWGGISDLTLNGATDARKSEGHVPVYLVHGWSGHGVAQAVRIGKAISDDLTGENSDYAMLTAIDHAGIPLGRYLSPVAIPLIKGALGVRNAINPADMISF